MYEIIATITFAISMIAILVFWSTLDFIINNSEKPISKKLWFLTKIVDSDDPKYHWATALRYVILIILMFMAVALSMVWMVIPIFGIACLITGLIKSQTKKVLNLIDSRDSK